MGEKSGFSELGAEFIERLAKEIDYLHRRIDCLETSLMMLENHCNEQEHLLTETTVIMLNFLNYAASEDQSDLYSAIERLKLFLEEDGSDCYYSRSFWEEVGKVSSYWRK